MSIEDWESIGVEGFCDSIVTNVDIIESTACEKDVEPTRDNVLLDSNSTETTQDHDRVLRILSMMSWCISHHSFSLSLSTFTTHDTSIINKLRPGISRSCSVHGQTEPLSTRISSWVEWHMFKSCNWTDSHQIVWDDCVKNSPSIRTAFSNCEIEILSHGERLFYDHENICHQNGFIWIPVRFCGGARECTEIWVLVCAFVYASALGTQHETTLTALPRFDVNLYPLLWKLVLGCFNSNASVIAKSDDNMFAVSTH